MADVVQLTGGLLSLQESRFSELLGKRTPLQERAADGNKILNTSRRRTLRFARSSCGLNQAPMMLLRRADHIKREICLVQIDVCGFCETHRRQQQKGTKQEAG